MTTIEIDNNLGPLVRVKRGAECGYLHIAELARIILRTGNITTAGGATPFTDLLTPCNIAISQRPGGQAVSVIFTHARREIPINWTTSGWLGMVSIPPTVWWTRFTSGRLASSRLFVTVQRVMSLNDSATALRQWPYGNIHPGGLVCWGTTHPIVTIQNPYDIDRAFMESSFNSDLVLHHVTRSGVAFANWNQFIPAWRAARLLSVARQAAEPSHPDPIPEVPFCDHVDSLPASYSSIRAFAATVEA